MIQKLQTADVMVTRAYYPGFKTTNYEQHTDLKIKTKQLKVKPTLQLMFSLGFARFSLLSRLLTTRECT